MKRLFVLLFLTSSLTLLSANSRAESGFSFHSSSTTAIGKVVVSSVVFSADTTEQTTAFIPTVFVSSATEGGLHTITNTTASTCIQGSTITVSVVNGQRAKVSMQGTVESDNNAEVSFAFLKDGAYVDNFSTTNHTSSYESRANSEVPISWSYITQPLTGGSHSFCFIIRSATGVQTIPALDIVQYSVQTIN